MNHRRLPEWLKKQRSKKKATQSLASKLDGIPHSICEEAKCPNRSDCFSKGVLTFMILGTVCTRNCGFCSVSHGKPLPPDRLEIDRILASIDVLSLKFVVLTSPNRDDLSDGGAQHYADVIRAIKSRYPKVKTEVLIPDFKGESGPLKTVIDAKPDVLNHNLETVAPLYSTVRRGSVYQRSLTLLSKVKTMNPSMLTKTGLMVGLGESLEELTEAFKDIVDHGVDILTLGQYLKPDKNSLEVLKFYHPDEFVMLKERAEALGIRHVFAGPLVRSSYLADEVFQETTEKDTLFV